MADAHKTFRPIVAGQPAWQKQLRDRFAEIPPPPVSLDLGTAVIRPVSRDIAEGIILRYEWLGTMSASRRWYGIFFGPYCAGVTCVAVGNGTAGRAHLGYEVDPRALATLVRGACVHWAPPGANSKLVAWTVKLLRRDEPGAKLVVAYADEDAGEIGTIYQAAGWSYVGRTTTRLDLVAPSGKIVNQVSLTTWSRRRRGVDITRQREAILAAGWTTQQSSHKHRYVAILDRADEELAARIRSMSLPYPKRAGALLAEQGATYNLEAGAVSGTAAYQVEGDDASRSARSTKRRGSDPEED